MMVKKNQSLDMLHAGMALLPQSLINLKTKQAILLANHPEVQASVDALMRRLQGQGRVLLRPSGTEPVLRIMVEGQDANEVSREAQQLGDTIHQIAATLDSTETAM